MLTTDELCEHMMGLLHTPVRRYAHTGECLAVFRDCGEQQDPLVEDTAFREQLLEMADPACPIIYYELEGALYGVLETPQDGILILGPCALPTDSRSLADAVAARHGLDRKRPYRISHAALETFCAGISTIFHHCTGIKLSWEQIVTASFRTEDRFPLQQKTDEVYSNLQEQGKVHNPYSQERWEQDSIRRGDVESLKKSFQETYVGEVGVLSRDPVRQARNIAIVLVTLSTRSAMEGGVPAEIAFSLSDAFIQHVEELRQPAQIYAAAREMEIQLARMVAEHRVNLVQSGLVIRCKKEIGPRLHQKITVKELANVLGVTADYLSHVFSQEEGLSLSDYISREKIRYAQWRLTFTQDSCQNIAYAYGFSDQSHFGRVFKKWTGMTPRQYRESTQAGLGKTDKKQSDSLPES